MKTDGHICREKLAFKDLSVDEFRKGEWLQKIPKDVDQLEVTYKGKYLVLRFAKFINEEDK